MKKVSFFIMALLTAATAWAQTQSITYYDPVSHTNKTANAVYVYSGAEMNSLSTGWYYNDKTTGNVSVSLNRVAISGTVNLILCDGTSITFEKGLNVAEGATLNIYAQSGGSGELYAYSNDLESACIGSGSWQSFGTVNIYGGVIDALPKLSSNAAAIGGGNGGGGGSVNIYGGDVTATARYGGAGIGSGKQGSNTSITISGGTVTAYGGQTGTGQWDTGAAGIGGGTNGNSGSITISGGTVTSSGGYRGAGIGGGKSGSSGTILITGGTVNATGGYYGAGIGGGENGSSTAITISGGIINATGGNGATAIGGGNYGNGGIITISGGQVTATPNSSHGNGIGGYSPNTTADIRLGWTNATDFINTHDHAGTVTFNSTFVFEYNKTYVVSENNWSSSKIVPAYSISTTTPTNGTFGVSAQWAGAGANITVTPNPNANYIVGTVQYNDGTNHTITPSGSTYSFTMPSHNVTVSVTFIIDPAHFSVNGDEYTINSAQGWDLFCDMLEGGESFSGKTVKLGADISVSRMAGKTGSDDSTPFGGTFDGQGHTLTFNYTGSEDFIAPFSWTTWTASPIFRNLTVSGTINTTGAYAAGLVGHLYGTVTVEHCTSTIDITTASGAGGFVGLCEHTVNFSDCLSSAVIHSKGGNNSGFVGWSRASGYEINFTGCVFNGKLLQIDGEGGINGGFIGWTGSNKTVTITDCLVDPAALATGEAMATGSTATFARGWNATTTAINIYYTAALGSPQGKQARSITAGENVTTLANAGTPATVYSVSGITAYPTGIKYNGVIYAGNDETVNLTLGHSDLNGYIFTGYEASAGTLSGNANPYTLTMPDEDVIIDANYYLDPTHFEQTSSNEYIIHTATGWDLFCDMLAEGESFSGKTVKLDADISVSRMAGSEETPFSGTFNGQGHTLTFTHTAGANYVAPFGYVVGGSTADAAAAISHLNVATTITASGYRHMAGLIALQQGHVNVTDCHATVNINSTKRGTETDLYPAALVSQAATENNGTLTISSCTASGTIATDGKYASGLVGIVQGSANIVNCVSSVTINSSTAGDGTHGGFIAVQNNGSTIEGCLFNGKMLSVGTTATDCCGGFIGWRNGNISIKNSLYAPATLKNGETEVGAGSGSHPSYTFYRNDVTAGGTITNCYYIRTLGTPQGKQTRSITAGENVTTLENAGTPPTVYNVSGITAYPTGIKYNNVLYAGDGDNVSLTLGHSDIEHYTFNGYEASAGTLSGSANPYTLTMPDEDVTVTAVYKTTTMRGDVNGDNQVGIADVTALINYLLTDDATGINLDAADCNQDNNINISDVTALINFLLTDNW